jgi:hypothetical protein
MNLLKLPTDIYRIIYRQWYFPFVLQELTELVPEKDEYIVTQISNESETTIMTIIEFFSREGKEMRMICPSQNITRMNRADKLISIVGRRF